MKWKRVSLILTSAPLSTKNLTMSIELFWIAIESGHSIFQNILYKIMIDMKWKGNSYNYEWYEMKENSI